MAKSIRYRAPALEKGLEILELIARETVPLSLSAISQKLGRSKSEIFRMIVALETLGYIARQDDDEGYRITNRLFMLGMAQPPIRSLQDTALPVMQAVANAVMQSCHLVVPVDDEIVVIARVDSPGDIGYAVRLGHKRPINLTASGAVLFAFQAEETKARWLNRLRKRKDFDESEFLARVRKVRRDGYIRLRSSRVPSVTDISVPLFQGTIPIATIVMPYVEQTPVIAPIERATALLLSAAREISPVLGLGSSPLVASEAYAPNRRRGSRTR
jgi:DNA-binding IclR family transcriptional regulator